MQLVNPPPINAPAFPNDPTLKQTDLKAQLSSQNLAQTITDDFVAAFLHSGLPLTKLDHKSMRGLLQKYTKVEGMCDIIHLGAIECKLQGTKVCAI